MGNVILHQWDWTFSTVVTNPFDLLVTLANDCTRTDRPSFICVSPVLVYSWSYFPMYVQYILAGSGNTIAVLSSAKPL